MKILVTGATGHLGGAVIKQLLTKIKSEQISVITRNEEKQAEFQTKGFNSFLGNYDDLDSLEKAMNDVDIVLFISGGDQGDMMQEHKNIVDAAVNQKVKCIAYTSRSLKDRNNLVNQLVARHFETEDYIKQSGLKYIFFQNALYMDVLPLFIGQKVIETGISQPAGDGRVAYALRSEMGEAMANVLLENKTENKVYQFTGSENYSFYDVATALSELSNKEVKYTPVETADFEKMMLEKSFSMEMVKKILNFILDIKNGQEEVISNDLERKLGRKPTNLKNGLKLLFGL